MMGTPGNKKNILVTGAAGFVGSHLVDALLAKGYAVIGVDNFSTGSRANIAHLKPNQFFSFVEHDITQPLEIIEPLYAICNLACPASPPKYQADPIQTLKTNVFGAYYLLEMAKNKQAIFLQASTSEVYGDPTESPQRESYRGNVNPIGIRACYDEGKRAAETLCFDFQRMHGVPIKVARIFNTFGPRMSLDDGRVVSNFIAQTLRGEKLTMYGDGSQTRSFCFVSDLVLGLVKLLESEPEIIGPINLGNPAEITVRQLAEEIAELTQTEMNFVFNPLPADDPTRRCPDITQAQKLLHWEPEVLRKNGLEKTITYFKTIL